MSTDRDFDRIVGAWLDLMPSEAPDRTVDAILRAIDSTPQRRAIPLISRWRSPVNRIPLVAAATLLGIALLGGALLLIGSRPAQPILPGPTSPVPATSALERGPLEDALRADWLAVANAHPVLGNGAGPVSMSVGLAGSDVTASNFGAGYAYTSRSTQLGPDQLELALARDGGDCVAGARGLYRWSLSDDRSQLTLALLDDECSKRGIVYARTWSRSLVAATSVGSGVIDSMDPPFAVTLPDDAYQARTLDDFVEVGSERLSLMVFKNPQPFVDACSTAEERVPYEPGAAAFVQAFRDNDAFIVGPVTNLTVDGHDAINVVIEGKRDYERCPGQDLYQYTPQACACHFVVGQGAADSMLLVEVGPDTFLFIVSPINSPSERLIIDSLRIPFSLPAQ